MIKFKINLENHTAIEFLRQLNPKFCAQIKELWIDAKGVEQHEKADYDNELTNLLNKFTNLKSLHLNKSCVERLYSEDLTQEFSRWNISIF